MWFPTKYQAQRPKEALPLPQGVATQVGKTTSKLSKTRAWPLLKVVTSRTRPGDVEMPKRGSCQPVSAQKSPLTCAFLEHVLSLPAREEFFPHHLPSEANEIISGKHNCSRCSSAEPRQGNLIKNR